MELKPASNEQRSYQTEAFQIQRETVAYVECAEKVYLQAAGATLLEVDNFDLESVVVALQKRIADERDKLARIDRANNRHCDALAQIIRKRCLRAKVSGTPHPEDYFPTLEIGRTGTDMVPSALSSPCKSGGLAPHRIGLSPTPASGRPPKVRFRILSLGDESIYTACPHQRPLLFEGARSQLGPVFAQQKHNTYKTHDNKLALIIPNVCIGILSVPVVVWC